MALPMLSAPRALAPRHVHPVTVRPARPDDVPLLADLVYQVSARARFLRYFQPMPARCRRPGRRGVGAPARRAGRHPGRLRAG